MKKIFCFVIGITALLLILDIILSNNIIRVIAYELPSEKITASIRIVQLTDLHNYCFGKENSRLINRIERQTPDLIFMTGDMINEEEEDLSSICSLIKACCEIAPVYYSLGNHELGYIKKYGGSSDLTKEIENAGAVLLEQEYRDVLIKNQKLRIGGMYGYAMAEDFGDGSEQRFLEKYETTENYKILLAHIPEGLLLWKSMEKWKIDAAFSGHVHGGQVRIPFIGGLYDPEEGWFPTYTRGSFKLGNGTVILSSGLGSSRKLPRVNNLPELTVCEIE